MQIVLKIGFLFTLLLFGTIGAYSQKQLLGNLTNRTFESIPFATVQVDSNLYSSSDRNGFFNLEIPEEWTKVTLTIRALGYETIDTTIDVSLSKTYIKLQMEEKTFFLKEVEIRPDYTVYDRKNWTIHDYVVDNEKIIVLYSWGKKRKLGVYNLIGETLQNYEIENDFKGLEKSYLGTYLLKGKKEFIELAFRDGKLTEIGKNSMEFYNELILGCLGEVNDALLYKKYSIHNKRLQYYLSHEDEAPDIIIEVFDMNAAIVSQSYYNEIIAMYKMEANEFNLIDAGLWDGNLLDLAVSVPLMRIITQFLHLELKEVNATEFRVEDTLFVMDYIEKRLIQVNLSEKLSQYKTFKDFDWDKKDDVILKDAKTQKVILLRDKMLFHFRNNVKTAEFSNRTPLKLNGSFPEKYQLSNDLLYYISYDYKNRPSLKRSEVSNL